MTAPDNEPMTHILVRNLPDGQIELLALDIGGQEAVPVFPTPEPSETFASNTEKDLGAWESMPIPTRLIGGFIQHFYTEVEKVLLSPVTTPQGDPVKTDIMDVEDYAQLSTGKD